MEDILGDLNIDDANLDREWREFSTCCESSINKEGGHLKLC